jgi:hypothetical protein
MRTLCLLLIFTSLSLAQNRPKKKVKIKYKSHTQLDFTGEKIEGKVKAPAVFYIFQRKRSKGHEVAIPPRNLAFHQFEKKVILKKAMDK